MFFRIARCGFLSSCVLFLAACSSIPSQDGRLVDPTYRPQVAPTAKSVAEEAPAKAGPVDVYIVPLEDFPVATAKMLARRIAEDLKLNTRVAPTFNAARLAPGEFGQFNGEDIIAMVAPTAAELPDVNEKTVYIVYTRRDINEKDPKGRFLFSQGEKIPRMSVISSYRMYWDYRWVTPTADLSARLWKMSKRAVGDQYYGLPRSTDPRDIMFSPLRSVEDIDKLSNEFSGMPK